MTKLNNKGVSLIDCLIAIAVLALLVSPIIAQLFTTIQVSAEAKEKQYVIDDATDVYEYFRKYDTKELEKNIARENESGFKIVNMTKSSGLCELYKSNGDKILSIDKPAPGTSNKIKFDYAIYELEESDKFGRAGNKYRRVVVRSDLRNKLYENGYQIDYSVTNGSTNTLDSKFKFRSDNSIVVMSSTSKDDLYDDSKIEGIVVKKIDDVDDTYIKDFMKNPNDIDIGNVQDIDAEKMAIISGDATSIDYQLDLSLQNVLVQYATSHPESAIGTYANDPTGLNNYIKAVISNSSSTSKVRKIKVYITAGKNALGQPDIDATTNKPKFYTVKCDVTYRVTFSGNDLKAFDNFTSTTGEFTYPVLERNYYTTTPPDVYMIYEPLLLSTSMNSFVYYADNDYISIFTDKYTSGVNKNGTNDDYTDDLTFSGDDPSRIYLIRSNENWAKVASRNGANIASASNVRHFDEHAYYTYKFGKFVPVNIVINMEKLATDDHNVDLQPVDIYTNISNDSLHKPDEADLGQFTIDAADSSAPLAGTGYNRYSYDPKRIIRVDEEIGIEKIDRLGQITVRYQNFKDANNDGKYNPANGDTLEGDVTYITGAKGAD